jgi:hypothetical protein
VLGFIGVYSPILDIFDIFTQYIEPHLLRPKFPVISKYFPEIAFAPAERAHFRHREPLSFRDSFRITRKAARGARRSRVPVIAVPMISHGDEAVPLHRSRPSPVMAVVVA